MLVESLGLIALLGAALLLLLFWAGSIIYVYVDLNRRRFPEGKQLAWLALVVLLPVIGLLLYVLARRLARSRWSAGRHEAESIRRGITMVKPASAFERHSSTIPASQVWQPALAHTPPGRSPHTAYIPQSPAHYTLTIIEGPYAGSQFDLTQLPALIGRGSKTAIRLDDDLGVSREHAEIFEQDRRLHVRDLNSTHGTFVNELNILASALEPGDHVRVGVTVMVVRK
ncbi:MAG: FHA domain-containing protein [Chloroflexota bacterium]|nr:MAG: FHA domain-containing protein [Chloroflexota bacterium]